MEKFATYYFIYSSPQTCEGTSTVVLQNKKKENAA